jgi:hypothetical protein
MTLGAISDNWLLQDVASLLEKGLSPGEANYIEPDTQNNSHRYGTLPHAQVQTEALFDLLTDIVLRDEILVEEKHIQAWKSKNGPLLSAESAGVVRAFPFTEHFDKYKEARSLFVDQLCITESMRKQHDRNVVAWAANLTTPDQFLSQTLWGGAGMMARALAFDRCYTPHPVRKRLFRSAGLIPKRADASAAVGEFIKEKRVQLSQRHLGTEQRMALHMDIAPIPLKIIDESNSAQDLIKIALQFREEFSELRGWIAQFQEALAADNYSDIGKHTSLLRSVSKYIDSKMAITDPDSPAFTIGIGFLGFEFKANPLNAIQNRFGVRATINDLLLKGPGMASFNKYLGFFDEQHSRVGIQLAERFSNQKTAAG